MAPKENEYMNPEKAKLIVSDVSVASSTPSSDKYVSFAQDYRNANANSIGLIRNKLAVIGMDSRGMLRERRKCQFWSLVCFILICVLIHRIRYPSRPSGPYKLVQVQTGDDFFDFYDFYNGPDSIGSAGHQDYVGPIKDAKQKGLANVTEEEGTKYIYLNSNPTYEGKREALRLEGKKRFNRGLFIADIKHLPVGCGVWPAFWLTDDDNWPENGEVDIIEAMNYQTRARATLHTSEGCTMWGNVVPNSHTGEWDRAECIPDLYTGVPDCKTSKEADDCWSEAPHQWYNQGCAISDLRENTIGQPFNAGGGGVYALEWDPYNQYIRAWVFAPHESVPGNLAESLRTANAEEAEPISPNPEEWGAPFAYFAIGEKSACSESHFKNMRIIFNTAFCGSAAGNRFFADCPADITQSFNINSDPVLSCNAYVESNPAEMAEAYWKINGVYVYERQLVR